MNPLQQEKAIIEAEQLHQKLLKGEIGVLKATYYVHLRNFEHFKKINKDKKETPDLIKYRKHLEWELGLHREGYLILQNRIDALDSYISKLYNQAPEKEYLSQNREFKYRKYKRMFNDLKKRMKTSSRKEIIGMIANEFNVDEDNVDRLLKYQPKTGTK
jgi:hypothetical protein